MHSADGALIGFQEYKGLYIENTTSLTNHSKKETIRGIYMDKDSIVGTGPSGSDDIQSIMKAMGMPDAREFSGTYDEDHVSGILNNFVSAKPQTYCIGVDRDELICSLTNVMDRTGLPVSVIAEFFIAFGLEYLAIELFSNDDIDSVVSSTKKVIAEHYKHRWEKLS